MNVSSRFFVQSTSALLLVGLVALMGIVGMTYWLGVRAQIYFDDVIATRDARSVAAELRNALQTAESSQRGFLVTGNEIYLAPYDTAKTLAQRQLETFQRDFATYPQLAPLIDRLTTIIGNKVIEMDQTITLKRDRKDEEATAIFRTNRGKALMDEANVLFSGAISAADARLTTGVTEHRGNATWLRWFSIVGGITIVAVVGAAAVAVARYTRDLNAARDEVSALNLDLEGRVRRRTSDLMQANDEVQRFAYIVTHDLRAPLVNIMGFTSELEGGLHSLQAFLQQRDVAADTRPLAMQAQTAVNEDLPEAIGFIRSSTKKMDNLINAILRISREGRRSLRPETVNLKEVISSSATALHHQLVEAGGKLEIDIDVPPIVSDRLSIEQVFGNLLDNALKYRAKDRPIRIGVSGRVRSGDSVCIDVIDNGRGIAEQDQERVFELFRRAGVQDQPGEGIGLAYVRTVIRNLGGDITVTSKIGEGTTFRLVLPMAFQMLHGRAA